MKWLFSVLRYFLVAVSILVAGSLAWLGMTVLSPGLFVLAIIFFVSAAMVDAEINNGFLKRFFAKAPWREYKLIIVRRALNQKVENCEGELEEDPYLGLSKEIKKYQKCLHKDPLNDYAKKRLKELKENEEEILNHIAQEILRKYKEKDAETNAAITLSICIEEESETVRFSDAGKTYEVEKKTYKSKVTNEQTENVFTFSKEEINSLAKEFRRTSNALVLNGIVNVISAVGYFFGAQAALGAALPNMLAGISIVGVLTGPAILFPLAGLAAVVYAIATYKAVAEMYQSDFFKKLVSKIKEAWSKGGFGKRLGLVVVVSFVGLFVLGITVLFAGALWFPAKKIIKSLGVAGAITLGGGYIAATTVLTIEAIVEKDNKSIKSKIAKSFKQAWKSIKSTIKRENIFEIFNPFRFLKYIITIPIKFVFFVCHFGSTFLSGDRFANLKIAAGGHIGMGLAYVLGDLINDAVLYFIGKGEAHDGKLLDKILYFALAPLSLLDAGWRIIGEGIQSLIDYQKEKRIIKKGEGVSQETDNKIEEQQREDSTKRVLQVCEEETQQPSSNDNKKTPRGVGSNEQAGFPDKNVTRGREYKIVNAISCAFFGCRGIPEDRNKGIAAEVDDVAGNQTV